LTPPPPPGRDRIVARDESGRSWKRAGRKLRSISPRKPSGWYWDGYCKILQICCPPAWNPRGEMSSYPWAAGAGMDFAVDRDSRVKKRRSTGAAWGPLDQQRRRNRAPRGESYPAGEQHERIGRGGGRRSLKSPGDLVCLIEGRRGKSRQAPVKRPKKQMLLLAREVPYFSRGMTIIMVHARAGPCREVRLKSHLRSFSTGAGWSSDGSAGQSG